MSRSLSTDVCYHCGHSVCLGEDPRPITEKEARGYFREYQGMLVADAYCPICKAKYLAWMDEKNRLSVRDGSYRPREFNVYGQPFALSYRSTFDDEPGPSDLPEYDAQVIKTWHRVGPFVDRTNSTVRLRRSDIREIFRTGPDNMEINSPDVIADKLRELLGLAMA